jgi:hypothetical protein
MSSEEINVGRKAYQQIRLYKQGKRKRPWKYISAAFVTLQTCLFACINIRYVLILALWIIIFIFFVRRQISESRLYLENLNTLKKFRVLYGSDIPFIETDLRPNDAKRVDDKGKGKRSRELMPLFAFCIFLVIVLAFSHFILPSIISRH